MRAQPTSGAWIQFKHLLDPLQGHKLRSSRRLLIHLFNAFGLRRVRGVPKDMIKVLFKIRCPWFKHWSEKIEVEHSDKFG